MPKPKTDSRNRLIQATRRLLQRQGYQGTGLGQIVEESGAPRGSFYFLFPGGKEQLALAAIDESIRELKVHIEELAQKTSSVEEWIKALAGHVIHALSNSVFTEGCPVSTITLDSSHASPALRQACATAYDVLIEAAARVLVQYGRTPDEAKSLAVVLLSTVEGAMILSRAKRSVEPLLIAQEFILKTFVFSADA